MFGLFAPVPFPRPVLEGLDFTSSYQPWPLLENQFLIDWSFHMRKYSFFFCRYVCLYKTKPETT